jgi:hypothetical protein
MVGYAVATGAYATAIEAATGGIDVLADKAEGIANGVADTYAVVSAALVENANVLKDKAVEMGRSVIDTAASAVPEAVEDVRTAMNDFAASLGAMIHL